MHEHLPLGFRDKLAVLVAALACDDNDAGVLLRLGVLLGNGLRRGQRVAGAHRRLEPSAMFKVGHRRPVKVHADRRTHDRAGDHAVEIRRRRDAG